MPVKFAPSFKEYKKGTKKTAIKHEYIKHKSKDELFEYINKKAQSQKLDVKQS